MSNPIMKIGVKDFLGAFKRAWPGMFEKKPRWWRENWPAWKIEQAEYAEYKRRCSEETEYF